MLLYPNAKINIGLNITEKLKSGYHNIESCFCPVSLFDIIEVKESDSSELIFEIPTPEMPSDLESYMSSID